MIKVSTLLAQVQAPEIDYKELSPLFALVGGSIVVLMVGLIGPRFARAVLVPLLTAVALLAAIGLSIWIWQPGNRPTIIQGALGVDTLSLGMSMLFYVSGLATIVLSLRSHAVDEAGHGEYHCLLLGSITGMVVLAEAESLITLFIGFELLSIPLYVLCATELRRRTSLEAGLKYLVIGSVGSATLLYGLALIYGATGAMEFDAIAEALGSDTVSASDPLLLTGVALRHRARVQGVGGALPPVDAGRLPGRPTPITTFMAVATKAAAFAVFHPPLRPRVRPLPARLGAGARRARRGDHRDRQRGRDPAALGEAHARVVGRRAGRLPAGGRRGGHAARAAGHGLLPGRVPADERGGVRGGGRARAGVRARRRHLLVREPRHDLALAGVADDDRDAVAGGLPATAGFIGKFYLIDASVAGDYTWLGIMIVIGSMISLAYYLRVIAVMWMGRYELELPTVPPRRVRPVAGWSPEADARAQPEVLAIAVLFAAATIAFGLWPDPLFDVARDVGSSLPGLR